MTQLKVLCPVSSRGRHLVVRALTSAHLHSWLPIETYHPSDFLWIVSRSIHHASVTQFVERVFKGGKKIHLTGLVTLVDEMCREYYEAIDDCVDVMEEVDYTHFKLGNIVNSRDIALFLGTLHTIIYVLKTYNVDVSSRFEHYTLFAKEHGHVYSLELPVVRG